jgi:glycerol-3-phosphate acyltransferase PlsY
VDFLIIVIAYLLGSLPSGYFIVKHFLHKDIRTLGNNCTGATNVGRILGRKGFVLTFSIDFLKSFILILLISANNSNQYILLISILSIVLGHIYPIFLRFKGGKGIAVTIGAILAYNYVLLIVLIISFSVSYIIIRNFTISGLVALLTLPIYSIIFNKNLPQFIFLCLLNIIILIAHRENIIKFRTQD